MKKDAESKREKLAGSHYEPSSKKDQDELWEENMMKQLKQFEDRGLEEMTDNLKQAKKELKKLKKKKDKKEKKDKKDKSERKEKKAKKEKKIKELKESRKD